MIYRTRDITIQVIAVMHLRRHPDYWRFIPDVGQRDGEQRMSDMVGIPEIAKRLQVDGGTVRRLIACKSDALKLTVHRGKQNHLYLTRSDADKLIANYDGRRSPIAVTEEDTVKPNRYGSFYLIQLVPEALPNRVKIGYVDNVEQRLSEHRTAAPTARLLKSWPCKRSWDSITREGCKLVLNEVYEGNLQGFLDRAESFFSVMLDPDTARELSEHSPLYASSETSEPDEEKK